MRKYLLILLLIMPLVGFGQQLEDLQSKFVFQFGFVDEKKMCYGKGDDTTGFITPHNNRVYIDSIALNADSSFHFVFVGVEGWQNGLLFHIDAVEPPVSLKPIRNNDEQLADARKYIQHIKDSTTLASLTVDEFRAVVAKKILIGMSEDAVEYSWGKPNRKNKTITKNGISEQWIYVDNYIYFENGKLTTIQSMEK